ncbi:MAG: DUF4340 domain-containing protein [bacterium]|nr:DUF4340 domain-containing protein [bacterium]
MKTKPLIIMAAMLLVLFGVKMIQTSQKNDRFREPVLKQMAPEFSLDQVGSFIIVAPGSEDITIAREGVGWIVVNRFAHKAKADNLDRLVTSLSGLNGEFRSDDPAVLADYNLDESSAITLRVQGLTDESLGELLLGKALANGSGLFVRKPGEDKVYSVPDNILGNLGVWGDDRLPKITFFLDLQALTLDRNEVDAITLEHEGATLELTKVFAPAPADTIPVDRMQYEWYLGDTRLDRAKVDGIAGALTSIWARDVIDPLASYDFNSSDMRAVLRMAGGDRSVVEFGRLIEGPERGVALRIMGDGSIYLAQENLPDQVFLDREELLPVPVESMDE